MRGLIEGLPSPHPLGALLPALYQEDQLAQQFTSGLDEVLSPLLLTLDCLEAMVDPRLAPADFVEWLGGWVGLELDDSRPLEQRRALLARAVDMHAMRGTARGLAAQIEAFTGHHAEIEDNGGVGWSPKAGGDLPGDASARLVVRVPVSDPDSPDLRTIDALVAQIKPAHIPHRVEAVGP